MSALGHQDAFLRPRLSTRYRFSQETFGRTRGKRRDAPITGLPPSPPNGEFRAKVIKRTGFLHRLKAANAWQHGLDHHGCGDLRLLGTRQSVVAGIHRYDEVVGG